MMTSPTGNVQFKPAPPKVQAWTCTVCGLHWATEVINIDALASVDTVVWWCRLCDGHGTATTRPTAHSDGVEHLTAEHHATIGIPPKAPAGCRLSPIPVLRSRRRPVG